MSNVETLAGIILFFIFGAIALFIFWVAWFFLKIIYVIIVGCIAVVVGKISPKLGEKIMNSIPDEETESY